MIEKENPASRKSRVQGKQTQQSAKQESIENTAASQALGAYFTAARWLLWRSEIRDGRPNKTPYSPYGGRARTDDAETWATRQDAEEIARRIGNGAGGGVGIVLGETGDGLALGGIDLDSCRAPDDTIEDWAFEVIKRFKSYTEISPSGTGVKIFPDYA